VNVPQLRFDGFEGEWENLELKNLVKLEGGATPLKSEKKYWQNGHIPWVSSQEVGSKKLDKTTYNITEAAVSETSTKMVGKDTLILVVRSGILVRKIPLSITMIPMAINQDIKAMIIKDEKLHHLFLYQWMKKNEKAMLSNVVKGGTTVQSVNTPDLQDYLMGIPNIDEQNKITYFFELIDGKIEKQQEKIEKLEQFKKGMMQKIFSQELRFMDEGGGEFPEWEETTFGEISISMQYGMNTAAKEFDGENKYIRITDIDESSRRYIEDGKVSPLGKLSEEYLVKQGDILFARTGASTGKSYLYRETDGKMYYAGFLIKLRVREGVDSRFVYYQTLLKEYDQWVKVMSMRSGQPGINAQEYSSYKFSLPSLEEQIIIADFLDGIKNKVEKEKEKLMILEEQKKGFMQGMFI
jgi:type I restriction enzyme S subunit